MVHAATSFAAVAAALVLVTGMVTQYQAQLAARDGVVAPVEMLTEMLHDPACAADGHCRAWVVLKCQSKNVVLLFNIIFRTLNTRPSVIGETGERHALTFKFHVHPHLRGGVVHLTVARGPSGGGGGGAPGYPLRLKKFAEIQFP